MTGRVCFPLAALALLAAPQVRADSFPELLGRAPEGANAVVLVDVPALTKSAAVARAREGAEALSVVPKGVTALAITAQVDLHSNTPVWEAGLADYKGPAIDMRALAKRTLGALETVAGTETVETSRDSYIFKLSAGLYGFLRPTQRPVLARWLPKAKQGGPPLPSSRRRRSGPSPKAPPSRWPSTWRTSSPPEGRSPSCAN